MEVSVFKKLAIAAGAALALTAGPVGAAPSFGINQAATGGSVIPPNLITGTQLTGNSSELLHFSAGDTVVTVNQGFLRVDSVFNAATSSSTPISAGLNSGFYGLYVLFSFDTLYNAGASTGAAGQFGSVYDIQNLQYSMYIDVSGNTDFVTASSSGAGTEAGRTGDFGDDVLIAFGSDVPAPNVAGFNSGGGAFLNSLQTFALCNGAGTALIGGTVIAAAGCTSNMGTSYFYDPVPFYPLAFDAFNNTGNSLGERSGDLLAITQASGTITFQGVPEPASLALVGVAMLSLSLTARRRNKR